MNGPLWKEEHVGNLLSTYIYFRVRLLQWSPRSLSPFQSPAKRTMGWLATCGCFQSKSWVITAASPGACRRPSVKPVVHWRPWMSCQKPYRIWLLRCSSSPWLSVISLIRYSFNKKIFFTLSLEECRRPLNEPHCQLNSIQQEMSGQFYILLFNLGSGKRESPAMQYFLDTQWKRGCHEKLVKEKKCFAGSLHLETHNSF